MVVTPEQLVESLIELAGETIENLYCFKSENADDYNNQLQEIYEQYQTMKQ